MRKERTKQKNFRLPESLIHELAKVSDEVQDSQTDIVVSGVRARINQIKRRLEQRKERSNEVVTA